MSRCKVVVLRNNLVFELVLFWGPFLEVFRVVLGPDGGNFEYFWYFWSIIVRISFSIGLEWRAVVTTGSVIILQIVGVIL